MKPTFNFTKSLVIAISLAAAASILSCDDESPAQPEYLGVVLPHTDGTKILLLQDGRRIIPELGITDLQAQPLGSKLRVQFKVLSFDSGITRAEVTKSIAADQDQFENSEEELSGNYAGYAVAHSLIDSTDFVGNDIGLVLTATNASVLNMQPSYPLAGGYTYTTTGKTITFGLGTSFALPTLEGTYEFIRARRYANDQVTYVETLTLWRTVNGKFMSVDVMK